LKITRKKPNISSRKCFKRQIINSPQATQREKWPKERKKYRGMIEEDEKKKLEERRHNKVK